MRPSFAKAISRSVSSTAEDVRTAMTRCGGMPFFSGGGVRPRTA